MQLSWDTNPSSRPAMAQCYKWANSPEFERLRTEITLGDVSSISCACVGRVEPQWEEEVLNPPNLEQELTMSLGGTVSSIPKLGPLMNEEELRKLGILVPQKEDEDMQIEQRQEPLRSPASNDDNDHESEEASVNEEGYIMISPSHSVPEFVDSRGPSSKNSSPEKRFVSRSQSLESNQSSVVAIGAERHGATLEPYTQVWMCGRDQKKGLLATFLFPDNRKIYKVQLTSQSLRRHSAYTLFQLGRPLFGSRSLRRHRMCIFQDFMLMNPRRRGTMLKKDKQDKKQDKD